MDCKSLAKLGACYRAFFSSTLSMQHTKNRQKRRIKSAQMQPRPTRSARLKWQMTKIRKAINRRREPC
jgi:hypothetical protein